MKFKFTLPYIVLVLLSIPAVLPFLHTGFFSVHDDTQVPRVFEMMKSLQFGMFPVRWVPDLGYGYGYPIFNFYSPFPYYIGALFTFFHVNILAATKLMFILPVLFSGICMYLLLRKFSNEVIAGMGSVLYLYFPYHALNLYVRGDIGEVYTSLFLPLVGLGIFGLYTSSQKEHENWLGSVLLTSVSVAGIIISHNLSAFMLFLLIAPILLFIWISVKFHKTFFSLVALSFLLGFLLSAFYSLPAVFEMKYTNVTSQIGGGADYRDHFVCLNQLWDSPWGFGGSTRGCVDGLSFRLGKLNVILFLFSIGTFVYIFVKKRKKNKMELFVLGVSVIFTIIAVFLTLDWSRFIWTLPAMVYLQYPWRFLNFAGFFMVISIVVAFSLLKAIPKNLMICLVIVIIGSSFATNAKLFSPQQFFPVQSSHYANLSYIHWDVSKISDEYLPAGFRKPLSKSSVPQEKFEVVNGIGDISPAQYKNGKISSHAVLAVNSIIHINQAPFPFWQVMVDGSQSDFAKTNMGMRIIVPAGNHTIRLVFRSTGVETTGNILSTIGVLLLLGGVIKLAYGYKKTS